MDVPNKQHNRSVRIEFDNETIARIDNGPLRVTGGKGKTAWIRTLVEKALDDYELIMTNRTQIEMSVFKPEIKLYQEQEVQNDLS